MAKYTKDEQAQALARLRDWLKPGDTVFTILRSVSRSGMSREIGIVIPTKGDDGRPCDFIHPNHATAAVLGLTLGNRDGVKVGGCGMDMGFHVVYNLGRVLYRDGFGCAGSNYQSNDHSNGDRSRLPHMAVGGCRIGRRPCTCHDPGAWTPVPTDQAEPALDHVTYPLGCSTCGCHRVPHWHTDGGYALRHRWL